MESENGAGKWGGIVFGIVLAVIVIVLDVADLPPVSSINEWQAGWNNGRYYPKLTFLIVLLIALIPYGIILLIIHLVREQMRASALPRSRSRKHSRRVEYEDEPTPNRTRSRRDEEEDEPPACRARSRHEEEDEEPAPKRRPRREEDEEEPRGASGCAGRRTIDQIGLYARPRAPDCGPDSPPPLARS